MLANRSRPLSFLLFFVLFSFILSSCDQERGEVAEENNQFGGKTFLEDHPKNTRLKQRRTYFDANEVKRKEERYPVTAAAINLGFLSQIVTYNAQGDITSDLREAPEDLANEFGYLSFHRTYGPRKKLLTGEIQFKAMKTKKLGYVFSTIVYNQKGRPEKVFYYDKDKKLLFSGPVKKKRKPAL